MKHFVVVGAGFGGLATAARLAHRGHRVTVLEKNSYVGGRNRTLRVGSCQFDSGPTLLMMLDPFRKLFADLGEDFDAVVRPQLCDPSYRVFWRDGSRLDATTNVQRMTDRLRAVVGDRDADRYPAFLDSLRQLYDDAIPHFVRKNYRKLSDFASPPQLARVLKHGMLGNLASRVNRTFGDPRVQMLMSFQSMYLGLSPFDAPFVYATLAYMEYGEGIFYPPGGLGGLSTRLMQMGKDRGVEFRLSCPVSRVESRKVVTSSGESIQADAVIVNADLPYSRERLEGRPRRRYRSSCSAHVMMIDYEGTIPEIEHHNVFFGTDFRDNLDSLFHHLQMPSDPAFYVCASCETDPTVAPEGHTNLFLLVPVPNLEYPATLDETARLEATVLQRLAYETSFDLSAVRTVERRGPAEWSSELNLDRGAAFGISADLFQSAFMRPQNKSPLDGVYYVGASTVPGNGLPMVLISAELVESRLEGEGLLA